MCTVSDGTVSATRQSIDERLFDAWKSGDETACAEIWVLFNARLFTTAVRFCRRFVDEPTAWQTATSAFSDTWEELDPEGRKQGIIWLGERPLLGFVLGRLIFRCRDHLRAEWGWLVRFLDVEEDTDDEGGDHLLDRLGCQPATQERDLVRRVRDRESLRFTVQTLAMLREICRLRPKLLQVVEGMQQYLRDRLIDAGEEVGATHGGRQWATLSIDELAEAVEPERVEATKSQMYRDIMDTLTLSRNVFDLRIKQIRGALKLMSDRDGAVDENEDDT
jgi:hypothetical protein